MGSLIGVINVSVTVNHKEITFRLAAMTSVTPAALHHDHDTTNITSIFTVQHAR